MTLSLGLAFLWLIAANVAGMLPSKDHHWTRAYFLIGFGLPLLGWVTYENGLIWGALFLAAGMSVLRWPVIYLGRWLRRMLGRESHD